jgi:hypothetical protein
MFSALALKIWNWVCSRRVPAEEEVSAASLYDDISPRSAHRENLQTRLHWNAFKWSWRCCSSSLSANYLRSSLLTQRHALHAHKAHSQDEIKQLRFPSLQTPQQCTKHSVATPWPVRCSWTPRESTYYNPTAMKSVTTGKIMPQNCRFSSTAYTWAILWRRTSRTSNPATFVKTRSQRKRNPTHEYSM